MTGNAHFSNTMKNLFARIADRYDTMNRIMSLGLDCLWRRSALKYIELPEGCKILDLACGTGDFTIELARRWPNTEIIGVDLTPEMLDIAREKLSAIQNATYLTGDAQNLPMLESKQFALIVCAFGFRNVPDKAKALSECHRLLADGGRLVVLELFRPTSRIIGTLVNTWLAVVSRIFASGASTEYRYLRRSVANTVTATDFITMAEGIGFSVCRSSFFLPAATCITLKKEQHA